LLRTAIMSRFTQGRRHGYDSRSIKEPLASSLYDVRHRVSRALHAVDRNRILTGQALGYAPHGAPDFGLDRAMLAAPDARYAIFLHATARPEKQWPERNWIMLGKALGLDIVLPWGTEDERARSERIAASIPSARVPERQPLDEVARLIAGAQFVVGVDTGLLHLAAALGVPLVAIFAGSEPSLTKPVGNGPLAVLGARGAPPPVDAVKQAVDALPR
jgi:heptosyltransferase-1